MVIKVRPRLWLRHPEMQEAVEWFKKHYPAEFAADLPIPLDDKRARTVFRECAAKMLAGTAT